MKKMTDDEMLLYAAKAAGYKVAKIHKDGQLMHFYNNAGDSYAWDPLNDDREAFRLLVKLNLDINFTESLIDCGIPIAKSYDEEKDTRYAIVRAAAEIGKKINDKIVTNVSNRVDSITSEKYIEFTCKISPDELKLFTSEYTNEDKINLISKIVSEITELRKNKK